MAGTRGSCSPADGDLLRTIDSIYRAWGRKQHLERSIQVREEVVAPHLGSLQLLSGEQRRAHCQLPQGPFTKCSTFIRTDETIRGINKSAKLESRTCCHRISGDDPRIKTKCRTPESSKELYSDFPELRRTMKNIRELGCGSTVIEVSRSRHTVLECGRCKQLL